MKRVTCNLRRVTCSIIFFLILGLTGCSDNAQTSSGTTTTTTLPPPQAGVVLGQVDFAKNAANLVDAAGVFSPGGIAVDRSASPNRLYIADTQNNRVLRYNDVTTLTNGDPADIVIGQADLNSSSCNQGVTVGANTLCGPTAVAVDTAGNLYVADTNNNRVLVYTGTIITGMNANIVLGQSDFNTNTNNSGGVGPSSLSIPAGVAVDSIGNLYVADTDNNRVLEYNTPLTVGKAAARIFGQPDFASNGINTGGVSASSLNIPQGVAVDSTGNVYVSDTGNNRALEYDTPLTSGTTADRVFGQGDDLTTNICNNTAVAVGGLSSKSLCNPQGVALDNSGNLYVADTNNNRVLEYTTPLTTGTTANQVFGQNGNFANPPPPIPSHPANACNNTDSVVAVGGLGSKSLCVPQGVALDSSGNLYVADTNNSRVLQYLTPLTTDTMADLVLGQLVFTTNGTNFVKAAGLNAPKTMAVDRSVMPNRLYIADTQNNRVLGYSDVSLLATGGSADIVIGQPDFNSNQCNQGTTISAATLCGPLGIAVDSSGNLYVADANNNRVLEYDTPFASGTTADHVFGQGDDPTTNICNNSAVAVGGLSSKSLCAPQGVALDSADNLYIADTDNNRVLEYDTPLTTDTTADIVFGQPALTTNPSSCNNSALPSENSLCLPEGIALDGADNLYAADTGNNRVLEYNTPLTTDTTADRVFGQPDFNSNAINANNPGTPPTPSATSLFSPVAVSVDSSNNLYVADTNNNRVLEFIAPLADSVADDIFGQPGFTSSLCNNSTASIGGLSDKSLCYPEGVALDSSGNLYVGDTRNNRVLQFGP